MIGRRGERGSGISVLAARHDDVDVLFYDTIRRDSVSLLRFPFLSYFQVFSHVCRFKYLYSFFSSHFYFLIIVLSMLVFVLFLVAIINISLGFFM